MKVEGQENVLSQQPSVKNLSPGRESDWLEQMFLRVYVNRRLRIIIATVFVNEVVTGDLTQNGVGIRDSG